MSYTTMNRPPLPRLSQRPPAFHRKWLLAAAICGGVALVLGLVANSMQFGGSFWKDGSGAKLLQDLLGKDSRAFDVALKVQALFDLAIVASVAVALCSLAAGGEKRLIPDRRRSRDDD
ncbi:MAG TPA: hypothetical protein VHR66_02940 [Gemmataceae bacterium]|jgi:hypothetical protein|nr:hypothetical protein [Gemmataceae bacterium]